MDWRARFNLAVSLEELGRKELARAEYEWILCSRPQDLRASVNLAAIEIEEGNTESGYARLEATIAHYPTMAMPRVALATHYLRDGRLDEAEALVRGALASDDADVEANFLLGEILVRKADSLPDRRAAIAEARRAYQTALENEPDDVASLLALGRLERLEGRPGLARDYYRRVLLQRRQSLEAHEALARLSEERGDLEDAVYHLWEVRALGGDGRSEVSARLIELYGELLRQEESRAASRPEQP